MEMAHAEAVHAGSGPAAFPSPILVTGSSGLLGAALGLGWRPEWTFASLVARMASGDECARLGAY